MFPENINILREKLHFELNIPRMQLCSWCSHHSHFAGNKTSWPAVPFVASFQNIQCKNCFNLKRANPPPLGRSIFFCVGVKNTFSIKCRFATHEIITFLESILVALQSIIHKSALQQSIMLCLDFWQGWYSLLLNNSKWAQHDHHDSGTVASHNFWLCPFQQSLAKLRNGLPFRILVAAVVLPFLWTIVGFLSAYLIHNIHVTFRIYQHLHDVWFPLWGHVNCARVMLKMKASGNKFQAQGWCLLFSYLSGDDGTNDSSVTCTIAGAWPHGKDIVLADLKVVKQPKISVLKDISCEKCFRFQGEITLCPKIAFYTHRVWHPVDITSLIYEHSDVFCVPESTGLPEGFLLAGRQPHPCIDSDRNPSNRPIITFHQRWKMYFVFSFGRVICLAGDMLVLGWKVAQEQKLNEVDGWFRKQAGPFSSFCSSMKSSVSIRREMDSSRSISNLSFPIIRGFFSDFSLWIEIKYEDFLHFSNVSDNFQTTCPKPCELNFWTG